MFSVGLEDRGKDRKERGGEGLDGKGAKRWDRSTKFIC